MKKRLFGLGITILAAAAVTMGIYLKMNTNENEKENAAAKDTVYEEADAREEKGGMPAEAAAYDEDENESAEEAAENFGKKKGDNVTISASYILLSDEEIMQYTDIILRGTVECKEKEDVLTSENYSIPYSLFKVKVSQYLLNDMEKEEEYVLFSYGGTELPDRLEYGKEYIFYLNHDAETAGAGKGTLALVSLNQALYEKNDNSEWENTMKEEKSIEDIQKDIQEYKE